MVRWPFIGRIFPAPKSVKAIPKPGNGMRSIPSGQVRVGVYIVMIIDVGGRLPASGVAGDRLRIWVLVDSNVIESHSCWQQWSQAREIKGRETDRHAKIENDRHWLLWDDSLPNVAVWPDC